MSEKSKLRRAKRKAKEEQQAQKVIKWLTIALAIGAVIFMVVAINMQ